MDNFYDNRPDNYLSPDVFSSELDAWFLVSGDMDDFIFYDEPDRYHSEK